MNTYLQNDTIFALSTPYGKSGISIIRISGLLSLECIEYFSIKKKIVPRVATLVRIKDSIHNVLIDEIIIVFFPQNHSYTGQNLLELHCHGSIAIIKKILSELDNITGFRFAYRGEFTKLALINNKISISKAESLINIINSETELQRQVAIQSCYGGDNRILRALKDRVISILAHAEAFIDFPDDTYSEYIELNDMIYALINCFQNINNKIESARTLMEGINIVILGEVNVGKSTLMNALTQNNTSIVSKIRGTTRDIVKYKAEIAGIPVIFSDTAGIRQSNDYIESIGIKKTFTTACSSQIIILLVDINTNITLEFLKEIKKILQFQQKVLLLFNKKDLCCMHSVALREQYLRNKLNIKYLTSFSITLMSQKDIRKITYVLKKIIHDIVPLENNHMLLNIQKHSLVKNCLDFLHAALKHKTLELKSIELAEVAQQMGFLLGKVHNDEILDKIFNDFCIGK